MKRNTIKDIYSLKCVEIEVVGDFAYIKYSEALVTYRYNRVGYWYVFGIEESDETKNKYQEINHNYWF